MLWLLGKDVQHKLTHIGPNYIQLEHNNVTCLCFVRHIYSSKVKFTYQINFIVGRFAAPLTYPGIADLYDTNIGNPLGCLKVWTVFESPIFMLG